ncbi:lactate utilization protein [Desulfonema ishimotonii]|uniref:Lactate utilization protein n=1 Tax=Desulfonema ishimotonii TaxID=45657 RepID=A0A401FWH2_9BACT|nr:lactate utilization protein [Desulfonema ishimotonii]GBC61310.1 lactate utilization protein [Desulfonema ishimotonii]
MLTPNSNQGRFIRNIRAALGKSEHDIPAREAAIFTSRKSPAQAQSLETIRSRSDAEQRALLDRLIEEGKPLNLKVIPQKDVASAAAAIAGLVAGTSPEWGDRKSVVQWDHPLISELNLSAALGEQNVPVHTAAFEGDADRAGQRARIRQQVTDAYIGVTSADFCLADTATLVMKTRPGEARSVSLVPSVHVAVIRLEQILADLKELYAMLKWDPDQQAEGLTHHMAFISGPSKTADIELVMVHGAHGPRALWLYVITG